MSGTVVTLVTVVTVVTVVVLKLRKSMVSRCKQSLSEVYTFIGTRFFGIFFGVTVPLNSSSHFTSNHFQPTIKTLHPIMKFHIPFVFRVY